MLFLSVQSQEIQLYQAVVFDLEWGGGCLRAVKDYGSPPFQNAYVYILRIFFMLFPWLCGFQEPRLRTSKAPSII